MTFPDRTFEERLCDPGDFATWLALFALSSAAGKPEAIPLPDYLSDYWPAYAKVGVEGSKPFARSINSMP
jgi:hypothetical protein